MTLERVLSLVAGLASGIGLAVLGVSVLVQARQARIAQLQAVRMHQFELFRLAYEQTDLQNVLGRTSEMGPAEWRQHTYLNLIFRHFEMAYLIKGVTRGDLKRVMEETFRDSFAQKYWDHAGPDFMLNAGSRRARGFHRLVQSAYDRAATAATTDGVAAVRRGVTEDGAKL
jgi:hypothetical protein